MDKKEITLDELIQDTKEKEARIAEPSVVTSQIKQMCAVLKDVANKTESGELKGARILTDYDADGICSAYIMHRTLQCMNPDMDVNVVCNDRRGSYGVPKDAEASEGVQDIILDMGSNELGFIQGTLGAKDIQPIVIDHHLIETDIAGKQFRDNPRYLNPHCVKEEDGKSAEYCATGLAYRCFQELANDGAFTIPYDEKIDRSVAIYAAIGTTSDVVDLMDMHSYNRDIVKRGIELIDTANPDNTDFVLGAMLETVGISEHTNAKEIAYNAGAYLNASSRMSEVIEDNGAMLMYEMLSSNPTTDLGREPSAKVDYALEDFRDLNTLKKDIVKCVQNTPEYTEFLEKEQASDTGIAVFVVPENIEFTSSKGEPLHYKDKPAHYTAAMNGLVAGQVEDKLDKAVIVLSKKGSEYTGSGRSPEGYDSLNGFLRMAMKEAGLEDDVKFGGHEAAIGISSIPEDKLQDFIQAVERFAPEFTKSVEPMTVIKLTPNEIANQGLVLHKVHELEPIGQGCKLPPTIIEGTEQRKTTGFMQNNPKWKKVTVKTDEKGEDNKPVTMTVTDWNYPTYPSGDKDRVTILADIAVSNFRGEHIEMTARFDKDFASEHTKDLTAVKETKTKPVGRD